MAGDIEDIPGELLSKKSKLNLSNRTSLNVVRPSPVLCTGIGSC